MPLLEGLTIKEAKTILNDLGLDFSTDTENQESIIINQLPKKGIQVNSGTKVILYTK